MLFLPDDDAPPLLLPDAEDGADEAEEADAAAGAASGSVSNESSATFSAATFCSAASWSG